MKAAVFSILDTPAYGGAEQYLFAALKVLVQDGHPVVLGINNETVKKIYRERIAQDNLKDFTVIDLPYRLDAIGNWKGLVKYFLALLPSVFWIIGKISRLQSRKFSIFNFQFSIKNQVICLFPGYTDRLSFSPIAKWMGCKLIWIEYGPLEPVFKRTWGFPKVLYSVGKPFPDKVITVSNYSKQSSIKTGGMSEEKIEIIYPAIENVTSKKIENHKFTAVSLGRLASEKQFDLLLYAWKQANIDGNLAIIGDGPERYLYEELSTKLGLQKTVQFTGFLGEEKKRRLLKSADVFIFPSSWAWEGFGMTTAEACGMGIPVITSGFGPQPEIVPSEKYGYLFKADNRESLAQKIREVSKDKNRIQVGMNAQKRAKELFSPILFKEKYEAIFA